MNFENEFQKFEGYWISCTNNDYLTKYKTLHEAFLALKEKYRQGYKDYGITYCCKKYEVRKYHPDPYPGNTGYKKANDTHRLTIHINGIKLYYQCINEEERLVLKEEIGRVPHHKEWTVKKKGKQNSWIYKNI